MNLNMVAPLGLIGYGYPGRYILQELTKAGVNVALFPIGAVEVFGHDERDPIRIALANAGTYDSKAPSVRICAAGFQAEHVGRGKHAGFPFFELDRFDPHRGPPPQPVGCDPGGVAMGGGYRRVQGITVPTAVVPLGVDRSIFHEAVREGERRLSPGPTVFVNNGKWERRKGHDFLLEAFCNAFTPRDDVILKLLSNNYTFKQQDNDAWARLFLQSALGTRVQLVPRLVTQHEVAELIAGCDCGVFPSRAEGWNLGLLECMSVGLNVIATDYSAHTEFVSSLRTAGWFTST